LFQNFNGPNGLQGRNHEDRVGLHFVPTPLRTVSILPQSLAPRLRQRRRGKLSGQHIGTNPVQQPCDLQHFSKNKMLKYGMNLYI
jgi:hypothetical protein